MHGMGLYSKNKSYFFSILIEIIEKLQEVNGKIGYFNLAPIVSKTFNIMGLTKYSTVHSSEETAVTEL